MQILYFLMAASAVLWIAGRWSLLYANSQQERGPQTAVPWILTAGLVALAWLLTHGGGLAWEVLAVILVWGLVVLVIPLREEWVKYPNGPRVAATAVALAAIIAVATTFPDRRPSHGGHTSAGSTSVGENAWMVQLPARLPQLKRKPISAPQPAKSQLASILVKSKREEQAVARQEHVEAEAKARAEALKKTETQSHSRHLRFLAEKRAHTKARHARYLREKRARARARHARYLREKAQQEAAKQAPEQVPATQPATPAPTYTPPSTSTQTSKPAQTSKPKQTGPSPDPAPSGSANPPPSPDPAPNPSGGSASADTGGADPTSSAVSTGGTSGLDGT
jgi:hypothetical protein